MQWDSVDMFSCSDPLILNSHRKQNIAYASARGVRVVFSHTRSRFLLFYPCEIILSYIPV